MNIEKSPSQNQAGSANTPSIKEQVLEGLKTGKEYRSAFVEECIRSRITAQIKALRDHQKWDYKEFADAIGKKVSWAYRLEDPNESTPTIPTLLQVAGAHDIALDIRFIPFSRLVNDVATLTPESFEVRSFEEELATGPVEKKRRRNVRPSRSKDRRKGHRPRRDLPEKLGPRHADTIVGNYSYTIPSGANGVVSAVQSMGAI